MNHTIITYHLQSFLLTIGILFLGLVGHTQDSIKKLSAEQVLTIVKQNHPIAKQAAINIKMNAAEVMVARSAFDPILSTYYARKTFDGTNYYNYASPEITIPTWYGVDVLVGTENLTGNRLNDDATRGQTSYVGINIPLVKNLVIDRRRAAVQQAKIFNNLSYVEQRATLNNLAIEAMEAYWVWVKHYQQYIVVKNAVALNEQRLQLIRKTVRGGERPAIDTVETIAQLQSFQYAQNEQWLQFQNAGVWLSTYLWKNDTTTYFLPETVVPQTNWETEVDITKFNIVYNDLLDVATRNHPELISYNYKLDALGIEKKLKFQDLLPKLDFRYNQLGKGYNVLKTATTGPLFENNFQYGLKFEMPLLLRKGRGEYEKAKLKIESTKLDVAQKRIQIEAKVKSYFNEFITLKNQVALQTSNLENYRRLVRAEEIRFANGESSLFLINARENKALEAQEKLIELKTKYFKTIYAMQWSAGLLGR